MKKWIKGHIESITIVTLLLILASVVFYKSSSDTLPKNELPKITFVSLSKMKRSDIQLFGDKNQYVLAPANAYLSVGKKYAATYERKLAEVSERSTTNIQIKGEYWNLILYDLEKDDLPERKLDIYRIVRDFNKYSLPKELFGFYYRNGVSYFGIRLEDLSHKIPTFKDVYLNLETEKIEDFPMDTKFSQDSDIYALSRATNFDEVIHTKKYLNPENSIVSGISYNVISEKDINLYTLYPDLESKIIRKGWTLSIRSDKVTQEEVFETLLHWFAPKGQDLLTVYAYNDDLSVSDTQIHNSQEAKTWLEQHPKLREEIMGEETIEKNEEK